MLKWGGFINNAALIAKYVDIFKCPICSGRMEMVNARSLICSNHHCFDLARQGYINLLTHALKTKYDKKMFQARRVIYRSGFFGPLIDRISGEIINEIKNNSERVTMLDAGCGEGFLLSGIIERIEQNTTNDLLGVGVDIAKEGIIIASREYPNSIWCVADLAKCPFESEQFSFILNILSPSNYVEFKRMLSYGGLVIKVIPESNYLQELRHIFYEQTEKEHYSNDKTIELFQENLLLTDMQRLCYSVNMDSTLIEHLVNMTPLSWGTTEERLQKVVEMGLREITVDLTILFGKEKC